MQNMVTMSLEKYDKIKNEILDQNMKIANLTIEFKELTEELKAYMDALEKKDALIKEFVRASVSTGYGIYKDIEEYNINTKNLKELINSKYKDLFIEEYKLAKLEGDK